MSLTATRPFTPARVIAIALIALVALGLASFRLQSDTESVSVPAGAAALTHGEMAKIALGLLLVSAVLTVLSLLWLAWHIRRRGQFGPKTSAALRSVSPLVLGVAGWFFGVLIVLIALPTVFIGNELLGVLAVGVPIALCVYFAWVHLDWPTKIKLAGLAGTVGGALVGAWFGINSMTGLLAPVTAALGATAAANLPVIVLDIYRTRQQRRRVAPSISIQPAVHRVGT